MCIAYLKTFIIFIKLQKSTWYMIIEMFCINEFSVLDLFHKYLFMHILITERFSLQIVLNYFVKYAH